MNIMLHVLICVEYVVTPVVTQDITVVTLLTYSTKKVCLNCIDFVHINSPLCIYFFL